MDEVAAIAGPDGALRAFLEARVNGLVGRIGVTGHHDPEVLPACVRAGRGQRLCRTPGEGAHGGFLNRNPAAGPVARPGRPSA
jgi:hypothetical protein